MGEEESMPILISLKIESTLEKSGTTYLVDRRFDFCRCQQNFHVLDTKVADTNAPAFQSQIVRLQQSQNHLLSESVCLDLLHLCPTCWDIWYCQTRGVDKIKVNVRHPKLFRSKNHESTRLQPRKEHTLFTLFLMEVGMSRLFVPEYLVVTNMSERESPLSFKAMPVSPSFL